MNKEKNTSSSGADTAKFRTQQAVLHGDLSLLQTLFDEQGREIFQPDDAGTTLLHLACSGGNIPTIRWLLDHGMDINALDKFGGSPLFEAVYRDHADVVKLLKSHGARLAVPRANKAVSYSQFVISAVFLSILGYLIISGKIEGSRVLLVPILAGGVVLGIHEGIKGLMGKHTFGNS